MRKTTSTLVAITCSLIILLITNCNKKEVTTPTSNPSTNNPTVPVNPYTPPAETFKSTVRGFVQDIEGNYIQNAIVSAGNQTFTTDEDGMFELVNASFTGDFCYIKAQKQGYFTASTTVHGKVGSEYEITLVMVAQNNIHTFKATEAKTIVLLSGAKVNFPANAIKELDGTPYTGQVNVAINHINPDDENFSLIIPGGDLRAYTAEGENAQLYSYGMLNVELRDGAGNYLQLVDGKKATLTVPVPSKTNVASPPTIPLWYFDENKGVWIEEGRAKLENNVYTGTVTHFTPWNISKPFQKADVEGKLADCDGKLIGNTRIWMWQISLAVDNNGEFRGWVPAITAQKVDARTIFQRQEIDFSINFPTLSTTAINNLGTIKMTCYTRVIANVLDCNGDPFKGFFITYVGFKKVIRRISNGKLYIAYVGIGNQDVDIELKQGNIGEPYTKTVTLPTNGKKLDLGTITACPPTQTPIYFSFDYDDGNGVKSVSFDNIEIASAYLYTPRPPATRPLIIQLKELEWKRNLGSEVILRLKNSSLGKHPVDSVAPMSVDNMEIYIPDKNTTSTGTNFHFVTINITLTEFGKVGEPVKGTFTGECYVPSITGNVKITNGKFSVIRTQ